MLFLFDSSHHTREKGMEDVTQPWYEPSAAHFPNEILGGKIKIQAVKITQP